MSCCVDIQKTLQWKMDWFYVIEYQERCL